MGGIIIFAAGLLTGSFLTLFSVAATNINKVEERAMKMMRVKLDPGAYMPARAHEQDAGYDLRTPERVVLHPGCSVKIDTGVHIWLPAGKCAVVVSKSGLNVNSDITSTGLIDEGFTGTIVIKLYNHGAQFHVFQKGDKIIQLVILPIYTPWLERVDELEDTDRGTGGFGSTGR